jgi:hypothetical protein
LRDVRFVSIGRITLTESLFYYALGTDYSSFQNVNWEPVFYANQYPADYSTVCGTDTQCLRVYALTKDPVLAKATAIAAGTATVLTTSLGKETCV